MPAPANYVVYKNASITIDGDEFANAVTRARLVPEVNKQTLRTLVPDGVIVDIDSPVWTFELTGVQIWAADGIAKALHDAAGTQVEIVLAPKVGTGNPEATFTVIAEPVPFGGAQGEILTFEQELAVVGQPTFGTVSA
jgi:hypothetical protein